jgi:glycosyltransferase involved in cell wall biosynthesis
MSLTRRSIANGSANSAIAVLVQSELAAGSPATYEHGMFEGVRLAVVVPARNEEHLLPNTLATMPDFVDDVVVVDDASTDRTFEVASTLAGGRIRVHRHRRNRGVGAAIVTGYRIALDAGAHAIGVMAGDAQMHPDDLAGLARPVVSGEVDYAKGNRFGHPDARRIIPMERFVAGRVLSFLTRRAAGLPTLADSQCGYTVVSARAARLVDLDAVFPRYGYPNDLLGKIAGAGLKIRDVPVRPVYADEKSGIRLWHVPVILGLIARVAWERRSQKVSRGAADIHAQKARNSLTLAGESSLWCGPPKEDAHVGERPLRDAVSR